MIVNGLTIDLALGACGLHGIVPKTTLYSRVQAARRREKGFYDKRTAVEHKRRIDMVIDVDADDESTNISPVTICTSSSTICSTSSPSTKRSRLSPKQASAYRLQASRSKLDYDIRYKAAFKDATNLVAAKTGEPVKAICDRLNIAFNLDGKKRLARSTVYKATKGGLVGVSPMKKGPAPKIPEKFMALVATHAEVCQVGDGELKGKDLRRLIGASMIGTAHADSFKVESVWRKTRTVFPDALQAATKIAVEDARAQWTTYDNLNQWFDDVKKDLLKTGLVDDEVVLDDEGELVSEVDSKCIQNDDSSTWMRLTTIYPLLGTRAVLELFLTTIRFINEAQREESNLQDT